MLLQGLVLPALAAGEGAHPLYRRQSCERCGRSNRLGALVDAGDVRVAGAAECTEIVSAVLQHGVAVIRGQNLTHADQTAFTACLGSVVVLPPSFEGQDAQPGHPSIQRISNFWANGTWKGSGHSFGAYWHQDGDFWPRTHRHVLSVLYARSTPDSGGQTGFADLRRAYEGLDPTMRARANNESVIVSVRDIPDFAAGAEEELRLFEEVTNRLADTLPSSRACSVADAERAGEMTLILGSEQARGASESATALHRDLVVHATGRDYTYYHHWTPGDVVVWDNVQTLHRAFPFRNDGVVRRELFRTQARLSPSPEHLRLIAQGARDGDANAGAKASRSAEAPWMVDGGRTIWDPVPPNPSRRSGPSCDWLTDVVRLPEL